MKKHILFLAIIIFTATIISMLPKIVSGIPLSQQLSSDAEFHIVHWYEYSKDYKGNFLQDKFFQLDRRPAGDLFIDKTLVKIGEFFGFPLPEWNVAISMVALFSFLIGVYALSYLALDDSFLAFIIGLGSIIPTFALGGATWGFPALGYLPRDFAIGFCLWIFFLFLYGKKRKIAWLSYFTFFMAGIFANWYPVLFTHFTATMILTDIIQKRKISKEHIFYGMIFTVSASFAIFDIISKAKETIAPDLDILHERFRYMYIFSLQYGIFKYLRRIIIYAVWIPGIIFFFKKFFGEMKEETKKIISFWSSVWIASGIIMIFGIFLEQYTIYEKFLFSRTSVFLIFASMIITAELTKQLLNHLYPNHKMKNFVIISFLMIIFIGQSGIPTTYRSIRDTAKNATSAKKELASLAILKQHTVPTDIILAETLYSNKVRAYSLRSVYSSWKDGGVTLLNGNYARDWQSRWLETNKIFRTGDLNAIIQFGRANGATKVFIETSKIKNGFDVLKTLPVYQTDNYTIISLD